MGGVEHLHHLDPLHEDGVVDPCVDISNRLDHLVDVVLAYPVCEVGSAVTASCQQVPGHWPHDDDLLPLRSSDEGQQEEEDFLHVLLAYEL